MLDDLKYIHERDAQDALGVAEKQWKQLKHEYALKAPQLTRPDNIVYAGMGGSALAASLSQTWPGYVVPFEICRHYNLPQYVGPKTLVVVASYSGNTEETLSCLAEADKRQAQITIIAGGGKLMEIAQEKGYPLLLLPKAEQPRFATLYNLKALVTILECCGLVDTSEANETFEKTAQFLKSEVAEWLPTVPVERNPAKQLALEIMGKTPVVYSGPLLSPAAYKWKISFNENAKNVAWQGQYPEFNHNEFLGWTSHPTEKPYAVIDLRSNLEHERVQKRFDISDRLLSGMRPAAHIVQAEGKTAFEQLLWTTAFGDFVSIYLGLLNGVNPTPVAIVEKLKKELG